MKIKFQNNFLLKALYFAQSYDYIAYFDNNNYRDNFKGHSFDKMLAFGAENIFKSDENNALTKFDEFIAKNTDWLFGFFSYDLKNEIENLNSQGIDFINFPAIGFFVPKFIFIEKDNKIEFFSFGSEYGLLLEEISSLKIPKPSFPAINLSSKVSEAEYIRNVEKIKAHIFWGDIYEMNYCIEYYNDNVQINPLAIFRILNQISPSPYSTFMKFEGKYLLSSSPERFLKKKSQHIISQPIKGTSKRGENRDKDLFFANSLKNNRKERAENIMIVDLVRNDLSQVAQKGTVNVDELCGIYSFPKVFQMISTISAELKIGIRFTETIKSTFPPGSMTGAPKVRAMKLIEQYEQTKRGLYSGALGYITPERDFDFNVVIRSILYNSKNNYLSVMVGGAITSLSNAQAEYKECLLKAEAMKQALKGRYTLD